MPDTPDLIMELNDFANHCGYFFNACMQDGINFVDGNGKPVNIYEMPQFRMY